MSNLLIEDATLTGIANAIRGKEGSSNPIQVRDFAQRIANLPSGGSFTLTGNMQYGNAFAQMLNDGLDVDTSGVTSMMGMFYLCTLSSLDLTGLDTSNVEDMEHMFNTCSALSIDVSTWDTSNVTNMYYMFRNTKCAQLNLSNFNTGKVTNMANMFADSKLTSLDLSNFNTSEVTNMSNMFYFSNSLQTLNLSSFDTRKVTNMGSIFLPTNNLRSITFGSLWKTPSSGTYAATTGTWTNTVTGVSYTGLQALLEAGRTQGAIAGTWVKS